MKRFHANEFYNNPKKIKNDDDDLLFQGNEADEALIAHLVDIEPAVIRQTQPIPNPPMADENDEFSDELDDAAFEELQVQETEFLRQTQAMEISMPSSFTNTTLPLRNETLDQNSRWKDEFQKVINFTVNIN